MKKVIRIVVLVMLVMSYCTQVFAESPESKNPGYARPVPIDERIMSSLVPSFFVAVFWGVIVIYILAGCRRYISFSNIIGYSIWIGVIGFVIVRDATIIDLTFNEIIVVPRLFLASIVSSIVVFFWGISICFILILFGKYINFTIRRIVVRYSLWMGFILFIMVFGITCELAEIETLNEGFVTKISNSLHFVQRFIIGEESSTILSTQSWNKIWIITAMTFCIVMLFQVTRGFRAYEQNDQTELFLSKQFGIRSTLASVLGGAILLSIISGYLITITLNLLKITPYKNGIIAPVYLGLSIALVGILGASISALINVISSRRSDIIGFIIMIVFYRISLFDNENYTDITWISQKCWVVRMAPYGENRIDLIMPMSILVTLIIVFAFIIEFINNKVKKR